MAKIMNKHILEFKCINMSDGQRFPIEYTGRGQNVSPEFIITNLSPEAKTLAIILEDMSHPIKNFTHWLIWNSYSLMFKPLIIVTLAYILEK